MSPLSGQAGAYSSLDEVVESLHGITGRNSPPGLSAAVVKEGRLVYLGAFGHADLPAGKPANPDTVYHWWSMTKVVTAVAALQLAEDGLLDLNVLCAEFPRDLAEARIAYAQSASLVNYIRDIHGRQTLQDLFAAYADGASCEGGTQRVLGFSLDRLESLWQESLLPRSGLALLWQANGAWIVLFGILAGLPLILVGRALLHARTSPGDLEEPSLR